MSIMALELQNHQNWSPVIQRLNSIDKSILKHVIESIESGTAEYEDLTQGIRKQIEHCIPFEMLSDNLQNKTGFFEALKYQTYLQKDKLKGGG